MEGLTAAEAGPCCRRPTSPRASKSSPISIAQKQIEIIETCDPESVSQLIADMPADDRVDLLNAVDEEVVEERDGARAGSTSGATSCGCKSYPEGTAGAVMTTEVARLPESLTVRRRSKS